MSVLTEGRASAPALPLRPYQREAIDAVRAAWGRGVNRVAVILPTGSGKTVVLSHLVAEEPGRTLVLAHRQELVDQAAAKIAAIDPGIRVGVDMADRRAGPECRAVVASVQTLASARRIAKWERGAFSQVIVDECHHSVASTYVGILDYFGCFRENGTRTLGVTATLKRGDGVGLGSVWQEVAYTRSILEMVADGYLVNPRGISVPIGLDLSGVTVAHGDYTAGSLGDALTEANFDDAVARAYTEHGDGRPGLAFTPTVATAQAAAQALRDAGVKAEAVWGNMDRDARRAAVAGLGDGSLDVLTNCNVLCLDAETEILTDRGWVGHDAMTPERRVANWDRGKVYFKEPYEVIVRDRAPGEEMYFLETVRRSIRVTGGHQMLYRTYREGKGGEYRKTPVERLAGRAARIPTCGTAEPEVSVDLTPDECALVGFWVGDGSANHPKSGGIEYTMSQSVTYPHIVAYVDALLDRIGIQYRRHDKSHYKVPHVRWSLPRGTGGGSQKRVGVKRFERYLDKNGSDLLWNLNEAQFDAFLMGLWYADGDHGQAVDGMPKSSGISATRLCLLEKIQAIGSVRGWTCSVRPCAPPRDPRHSQLYTLWFHRRREHAMGGIDPRYRIQREDAPWRPEKVWCVRTESRNIITRRHGSVTVMGNCEGTDIPRAEVAVMARPTRSATLFTQMVGRVLRPYPGKDDALVIDVVGATADNRLCTLLDLAEGQVPERREKERPKDGETLTEAVERIAGIRLGKAKDVDLFGASSAVWLKTRAGFWFVPAGDGYVALYTSPAAPGKYAVAMVPPAPGKPFYTTGAIEDVTLAMALGEEKAKAADRASGKRYSTSSRDASWRARKPTDKQLALARRMGLETAPGMRQGEVGDLITVRLASTRIDRALGGRPR